MSKKINGRNHSMTVPTVTRRRTQLTRLEKQLSSNQKQARDEKGRTLISELEPLTEKDKSRIIKEIETLKTRIV
jgi:uncharacterized protein (UPF0332 family)